MSHTPHPDETFMVSGHQVACNGGGGALGHPRVYLELGSEGKAVCGYCGRVFIHSDDEIGHYEDASARQDDHT